MHNYFKKSNKHNQALVFHMYHLVSGYATFCCLWFYFFFSFLICFSFSFLYWFLCFLMSFLWVVFDSKLGLLIPLATLAFIYCFLLKKFTLNTLSRDSTKFKLLPTFVEALNRIFSSFLFYLYLTRRGYYLSSSLAFSAMIFCLIYCLAFLLWALAKSDCQRPPLLKVNLNTGASLDLRFLERALIKSSGSGLTI
jgi:hypothetical protein